MDLGSIVAHLKLETREFVSGVRNAVQGMDQIENSINDLNRAADSLSGIGNQIAQPFQQGSKEATKYNKILEQLSYQLGGEVPEATKEAYRKQFELTNEIKKAERGYGTYSQQAMTARNALTEWALGLDDTTFKQVYMRSQLGLTEMQLQQQANSIKLTHRQTKLMSSQTEILTQRMQGLQKAGVRPEMLLPASTPGTFQLLNETIQAGHSPLNGLTKGFLTLGTNVEGVIKKYSAQKVAVREANGDMVKYGLVLRGIQTGLGNVTLALPLMGLAAVSAYSAMFKGAIEADAGLKELLDTTKGKVSEAFKPLIEVAGKFLEIVLKVVSAVAEWVIAFNEAHPVLSKILAVIGFLVPALTVLMTPLAMGVGLFKGWMLILNSIWPLISGLAGVIAAASGPALLLAAGIGVLVGGFIGLWKNCEGFRDFWINLWEKCKEIFSKFVSFIKQYLGETWNNFKQMWDGIAQIVKGAFDVILGVFTLDGEKIKKGFSNIWEGIKTYYSGFWDQVNLKTGGACQAIWSTIKNWGSSITTFFTQTLPNAWNNLINWFTELPSKIGEWLTKTYEKVAEWGTSVINWFTQLPEKIGEWLNRTIDRIVQWASDMVDKGIECAQNFVQGVIDFICQLPEKIWYWLVFAVSYVVLGAKMIIEEGIRLGKEFVENVVTFFQELPNKIATFFTTAYNNTVTWVNNMINKAIEVGTNFVQNVITFFQELPNKIATFFTNAYNNTVQWVSNMIAKAIELGKTFVDNIINGVKQLASKIWNALVDAYNKVVQWAKNMIDKAKSTATEFVNNVVNYMKELPGKLYNKLGECFNKVKEWGSKLIETGVNAVKSFPSKIISAIGDIGSKFVKIGRDICSGLVRGLTQGLRDVVAKAKEIANSAYTAAKRALGIASPSRLFRDEIGRMIPEGIAVGIDANADSALKSINSLTDSLALQSQYEPLSNTISSTGISSSPTNSTNDTNLIKSLLTELKKLTEKQTEYNINIEKVNANNTQDIRKLAEELEAFKRYNTTF